jgi:hypothetical protein
LKRLVCPPYPLDIPPSDLFLFGEVKPQRKRQPYTSVDELEMAIRSSLDPHGARIVKRIFEDWIAGSRAISVSDEKSITGE